MIDPKVREALEWLAGTQQRTHPRGHTLACEEPLGGPKYCTCGFHNSKAVSERAIAALASLSSDGQQGAQEPSDATCAAIMDKLFGKGNWRFNGTFEQVAWEHKREGAFALFRYLRDKGYFLPTLPSQGRVGVEEVMEVFTQWANRNKVMLHDPDTSVTRGGVRTAKDDLRVRLTTLLGQPSGNSGELGQPFEKVEELGDHVAGKKVGGDAAQSSSPGHPLQSSVEDSGRISATVHVHRGEGKLIEAGDAMYKCIQVLRHQPDWFRDALHAWDAARSTSQEENDRSGGRPGETPNT